MFFGVACKELQANTANYVKFIKCPLNVCNYGFIVRPDFLCRCFLETHSDYNYRVHCKDLRRIIGLINVYIESTPIITYKCIMYCFDKIFRFPCNL